MANKKKKKEKFVDDGRTVYDMDIEGFSWHDRKAKKKNDLGVTKSEKAAMIRGALIAYLPRILTLIAGFGLAFGLVYLWLT